MVTSPLIMPLGTDVNEVKGLQFVMEEIGLAFPLSLRSSYSSQFQAEKEDFHKEVCT